MLGQTCVRRPERLPVCFVMLLVDGRGVRPLELGPRCLAKRVQAATCVRRTEHLPVCFGMWLVDGHSVRPHEFSLLNWGSRLSDGHGTRPPQFCPMSLR